MRKSEVKRETQETEIICSVNLDGTGSSQIQTGIGFFNHMLELFSYHSLIDIKLSASGDTHVDFHHTVEDTGYVIAQAIIKALKIKKELKDMVFFMFLWMSVYHAVLLIFQEDQS